MTCCSVFLLGYCRPIHGGSADAGRFLFAVTRVIAPPGSELTPSRLHNDRGYFVLGRSKNNSVYEKPVPPLFAPSYLSALLAIALLPTAASSVYDFNGGLARAPVTPEHPVDVGPQPPLVPYDHRFSLAF